MNFQDEMKKVFLRVMEGEVEPADWEKWWKGHESLLEKALNRGDIRRMMPDGWRPCYYCMTKTQSGAAYYFHAQGRPVKASDYYEKKALEEEAQERKDLLDHFRRQTAPERARWEKYLEKHPAEPVVFDWKSLLGTPKGQIPAPVFSYKSARDDVQWKECRRELKLRLKENMQAKIAPLAKAYGFKKAGPKTFVKEKNGLVCFLKFIGYFRGGGYEAMVCYICPIYAISTGILGLPGDVSQGEYFRKMQKDWGVIQYGSSAVDQAEVEKINRKFDDILAYLAVGIFPEWEKIGSLETYFAKERLDYLKAVETGPNDPRTNRYMWDLSRGDKKDPWRAEEYLFGVWELLSGREAEGYRLLSECVEYGADYMKSILKERQDACSDPGDSMAVLYYNARLFAETEKIADPGRRRQAVLEVYDEVCRFMRYYHGLSGRVERKRVM